MKPVKCTGCKKDGLKPWEGLIELHGVEIKTCGKRCGLCGETEFTAESMEHNERTAATALVARGVRAGAEFKFVRKMAGFKAAEVAEMLAVRPETVSRWERGEIEIPRAAAFTIGELYERPVVTRRKLEAFAG
jgi:DNA-binding transcriptional regulator YiaG